jgi:hypothetical protein
LTQNRAHTICIEEVRLHLEHFFEVKTTNIEELLGGNLAMCAFNDLDRRVDTVDAAAYNLLLLVGHKVDLYVCVCLCLCVSESVSVRESVSKSHGECECERERGRKRERERERECEPQTEIILTVRV